VAGENVMVFNSCAVTGSKFSNHSSLFRLCFHSQSEALLTDQSHVDLTAVYKERSSTVWLVQCMS